MRPLFFKRIVVIGAFFVLFVNCVGCNSRNSLTVIPVKGKVLYKGAPLRSGQITFNLLKVPLGQPNRNAVATIDSNGEYSLSTLKKGDGAMPGEYSVAIVSFVKGAQAHTYDLEPEILIPKKYIQASTTPLRAKVPANSPGPLVLNFEILEK